MDVREKLSTEKRLIDANALMDVIRQHEYRLATKQGSIDYGMFTLGIQQAVDEQPTVDAAPVVRCKDCKHAIEIKKDYIKKLFIYGTKECECGRGDLCYGCSIVSNNGFCDSGERKEGDDDG